LTFSRHESAKLYKRESNPKIKERLLLVLKVEGDGMLPHAPDELPVLYKVYHTEFEI